MKQQQTVIVADSDCTLLSADNSSINNMPQWFSVRNTKNSNGNTVDNSHQTAEDGLVVDAIQGSGTDAHNFSFARVEDLFASLDSDNFAAGFL